jgi:hypothetical protein
VEDVRSTFNPSTMSVEDFIFAVERLRNAHLVVIQNGLSFSLSLIKNILCALNFNQTSKKKKSSSFFE